MKSEELPKERTKVERVRIVHKHDFFKGKIGYLVGTIDQHSLCTYVVQFKGFADKRAYQRNEIKFLKRVITPKEFL